ncbi:MAG: hypothetical protein N4A48_09135 [Tepidibacter sp.]|jgi:hypothetical protein|uniref:hypothetical protein n=1 Tax=Tepidibacter sp. TaxID=2529387 RepID=UPI0025DAE23A|nr:hypothetical protein [Tepidibacter sp.]MCT4508910.1 hypothetical protein [Tepidibacter sp.]
MYIKFAQNNNFLFYNKFQNKKSNTLKNNKEPINKIKDQELKTKIHLLKKIKITTEEKSVNMVNDLLKDEIRFLDEIGQLVERAKKAFADYINPASVDKTKIDKHTSQKELKDGKVCETNKAVYSISDSEKGRELIFESAIKTLFNMVELYSGITDGMAKYYKNNNSMVQGKIEEVLKNTNNDESLFDIGYKALGLEDLENLDLTKPDDLMKKFDNSLELIKEKRNRVQGAYSYLNNTYSSILNSNKNKFLINNQSKYINETL